MDPDIPFSGGGGAWNDTLYKGTVGSFGMNEWMNECLTTPQHEKQIGYWVSEKGKSGVLEGEH